MSEGIDYYPLDVTTLQKGQVLSLKELAKIINLPIGHKHWGVKLQQLKADIEKGRRNAGLPYLSIRTRLGQLVILTDSQAAAHHEKRMRQRLWRAKKHAAENMTVDESNLTEEERPIHRKQVMRQAFIVTAITSAQHSRPPQLSGPPKRTTPKMVCIGNGEKRT